MNKTELLNKVAQTPEERQLLARVCDQMDHAGRGVPACTPFLSTAQQEAAQRLIAATFGRGALRTRNGRSAPFFLIGRRKRTGSRPLLLCAAAGSPGTS